MILRALKFMSVLLFGIALITFFPLLSETGPTENQRLLAGTLFSAVFILNTITAWAAKGGSKVVGLLYLDMSIVSLLGALSIFAPEISRLVPLISGMS